MCGEILRTFLSCYAVYMYLWVCWARIKHSHANLGAIYQEYFPRIPSKSKLDVLISVGTDSLGITGIIRIVRDATYYHLHQLVFGKSPLSLTTLAESVIPWSSKWVSRRAAPPIDRSNSSCGTSNAITAPLLLLNLVL
jgi:hypothetical protein